MKDQKQPNQTNFKDVTIVDVKACKGYEKISDELAQKIADAIRVYTEIIYNCFRQGRFEEQKAKIVSFNQKENRKAA
jgi:hypothetical protein